MKYTANPVEVDAFRITKIESGEVHEDYRVTLEDGTVGVATGPMCARMKPSVGDYWVIQSDGYVYLNPKDVFERKYSQVKSAGQ